MNLSITPSSKFVIGYCSCYCWLLGYYYSLIHCGSLTIFMADGFIVLLVGIYECRLESRGFDRVNND